MQNSSFLERFTGPTARATVLFTILAVIVTWPLVAHLSTQVIGPFYGDNLEYVWKIWWTKHAILDLGQSPLIQPDIYYPFGYPLAYGEITPIHTYLGIPVTALFGPVATYNLFILLSVVLSGLFTYLFVRELTDSDPAGIVAGVGFALCPYHMARIAGNLPLVDTQWLPLFLLFLERFIQKTSGQTDKQGRPWLDAGLAGVFFAASALSSWYYALAWGVLAPEYLYTRTRKAWSKSNWQAWVRGGLAFAAASGALIVPFLLPYLEVQQAGAAKIPLEQTAFWSANLTDFFTPNPRHFLWGDWVQNHLTPFADLPYEFLLSWGLGLSILALFGWRRGRTLVGPGWGWWILVSFVLSLGPVFKLFNAIISLPAPAGLTGIINGTLNWLGQHSLANEAYTLAPAGRITLPLPALFLRWFIPGLVGLRSWGRFALYTTFGLATLAGAGTAAFLRDAARRSKLKTNTRWIVTALLAGLIFFEFYTGPQQMITPGPRPVDEWLADRPQATTLIQMPLLVALSGPQMYYSMHHGQRVASGYGTYLPILFEEQYPALQDFPSDAALELLHNWGGEGIDLVLVDQADVPADDPLWEAIEKQPLLEPVAEIDGVWVYEVRWTD